MPEVVKTRVEKSGDNFEALFEAANRDPELKKALLADPKQVAEKWNVKFTDQEVDQLTKLGVIAELADDVKFGRLYQRVDPRIFYPVSVWKVREVVDIIGHLIPHISYRGPETFPQVGGTMARMNARIPNVIFYPGPDDGTGGWGGRWRGGASWGTVINPGVIFYPAQLLARIELNLAARLRATAKLQE
jgi:hypothetical protein